MSLRKKTLLTTSLTLTALLCGLTLSLRAILLKSYQQIELDDTVKNIERAENAVASSLAGLAQATKDYSYWDDMFNYMGTRNADFLESSLAVVTLGNNNWSFVVLLDNDNQVAFERACNIDDKTGLDFPDAWRNAIQSHLKLLIPESDSTGKEGLLKTSDGLLLVAARKVLRTDASGPARGTMLTGRILSQTESQRIAEQTRLQLQWRPYEGSQAGIVPQAGTKALIVPEARTFQPVNDQSLRATSLLHDINGRPALELELNLPRTVYAQGRQSIYYLIISVIVCATVFSCMNMGLLERMVLSPVSRLTDEVVDLGDSYDLSRRVKLHGKDEIGLLSDSINRLLASHEKLHQLLDLEKSKSEKLLLNILPGSIAERLKEEASVIAESFDEASILFADIVDFTSISTELSPEHLVNLLNDVFSEFDMLAEKHGLEKIKTIGDAYMVVGGLPARRKDHAEAIARLALDMQRALDELSKTKGKKLMVRIGINSGPVVAGVIGTRKFLYDLWGDTVNVASRMEASGIAGSIQVTESSYQLLRETFDFQDRGSQFIKGKGLMHTYILIGERRRGREAA